VISNVRGLCGCQTGRADPRGGGEERMGQILLIEDDPRIQEIVQRGLGARGFSVASASDGPTGLDSARELDVDLVLLDLKLPGMEGERVLEGIRATNPRLPVIVLTALDDVRSKVGGLDAGADDYMTKPFSIEELVARIRARLRFRDDDGGILRAGPLVLDLAAHRATLEGREITLSAREIGLLAVFLRHPGQALSRGQLLRLVWHLDFDPGSNVVDVYVAALRRKIGAGFIQTVRGLGYRFTVPKENAS
jgi:DNA-binding response OmpR family regulator